MVAAQTNNGDSIDLRPRAGAARVVRLGNTTFYQRVRRKLRFIDSGEILAGLPDGGHRLAPGAGPGQTPDGPADRGRGA